MGSSLPSAGEVLIIRPAGKRVSRLFAYTGSAPSVPGHLPGSPGIPKQDPNAMRSSRNAVSYEIENTIPE